MPGLVWSYEFHDDGVGRQHVGSSADDLDARTKGFVWLHFDLVDLRVSDWCAGQRILGSKSRQVLLSADPHLRIDHADGQVWGLFADLAQEFGEESTEPSQLRFIMGPRWLVTGRRQPLKGTQLTRARIEDGARFHSPCAVLEAIGDCALEHVHEMIEALENELDLVEDHVLVRAKDDDERRLAPIRHKLVRHNRHLSKFSAVLHRFLARTEKAELPGDTQASMARLSQRIDTLRHDVEALQERARLLQEEAVDNRGAEMNRHLYVLSILTAVLMPATLMVSLFGINVGGLPLLHSEGGFVVVAALALLSSGFVYWLFHRMRRRRR